MDIIIYDYVHAQMYGATSSKSDVNILHADESIIIILSKNVNRCLSNFLWLFISLDLVQDPLVGHCARTIVLLVVMHG